MLGVRRGAPIVEDDSQLVDKDFAGLARLRQRRCVDGFQKLSDKEEVAENRKLLQEVAYLSARGFALGEPHAIAVIGDHRMLEDYLCDLSMKRVPPASAYNGPSTYRAVWKRRKTPLPLVAVSFSLDLLLEEECPSAGAHTVCDGL